MAGGYKFSSMDPFANCLQIFDPMKQQSFAQTLVWG